jgi:hypothetical protein
MASGVKCPNCGRVVEVTPDLAGMTIMCPGCDVSFEVPEGLGGPQPRPRPTREPQPAAQAKVTQSPPTREEPQAETPAQEWDLPGESTTVAPEALDYGVKHRRNMLIALGIGAAVAAAVVVAALIKPERPKIAPPPDFKQMNEDVAVGKLRYRVTSAEWRQLKAGQADTVLEIGLSLTNLDAAAIAVPPIVLGDPMGRKLLANVGTPLFEADNGTVVAKIEPGKTVSGHLVFQPMLGNYSLILSGGSGSDEKVEIVNLKAVRTKP